jgi:hypothetical protein
MQKRKSFSEQFEFTERIICLFSNWPNGAKNDEDAGLGLGFARPPQ